MGKGVIHEREAGAAPPSIPGEAMLSAYQLTLGGLRLPVWIHAAFNALAAAGMLLLGHPLFAAWAFIGSSAFDVIQQAVLSRWAAGGADVEEGHGLRRLALLCAVRVGVYTAPGFAMALGGGLAEFAFYGVQLTTLLVVALGAGLLSRLVFWAFAAPLLAQTAVIALLHFDPASAGAIMISLTVLAALLATVSGRATQSISAWHEAFLSNVALVEELEATRDEARRANSAKSAFLATMSHEIRTPMNGVLGMAQLLRRDETAPDQAARLDVLIDSGEYLLTILNDILDVSKIDAGRLELAPAHEEVRPFLERVVGFWAARADERGVALDLEVAPEVPEALLFDSLRMRQVLFNLVGNALKFTTAGSVGLIADVARWDDQTVHLHLAVRDTGPGIPERHLAALFDRFSQVDDTEARQFGGTGLGLSIVRQLVELMSGRVWVESEPGHGSTFHLEVPLPLASARAAAGADDLNTPVVFGVTQIKILAVDDNPVNLLVLEQLLASLGHTVARASSGAEALAAMAEEVFDLVLMDIQMPGMTGTEVLLKLRASPGPNQAVPVIALTADVTSGGRQRYLDLGFDEHSAKPIQLQDLLGAIARAMAAGPRRAVQAA